MAVWAHHAEYDKQAPKWVRARDAVAGQDAVHARAEAYLPMLKDQDENEYASYKKRATWFGASAMVVAGLVGMVFRKPAQFTLPAAITELAKDIDLAGTPLAFMAQEYVEEVLTVGRVGILVDHPPMVDLDGTTVTLGQAQALNLRPTMQLYKTESIINWKFRRVKNVWALCLVVLEESVAIPKDEFSDDYDKRWRVLSLDENNEYCQRVFRKRKEGDPPETPEQVQVGPTVWPTMDGKRMDYIPFFVASEDDVDICPHEPPLIDLFDLNLAHYRVTADYEHGCHFTGLPTPWIAGYTPEQDEDGAKPQKLYVGSQHAWVFPDPNAKAQYLEFHGTGLAALENNLNRKETQMAIVGSRMLVADNKGRSNESATSVAVHRTGESSRLSSIVNAVSTALTRALEVFCQWAQAPGVVEYSLNRDFMPVIMDANTLAALVTALTAKTIDFDTFWDMLQRGDIAPLDKTAQEALDNIAKDPDFAPKPPPAKETDVPPDKKAQQGGDTGVGQ